MKTNIPIRKSPKIILGDFSKLNSKQVIDAYQTLGKQLGKTRMATKNLSDRLSTFVVPNGTTKIGLVPSGTTKKIGFGPSPEYHLIFNARLESFGGGLRIIIPDFVETEISTFCSRIMQGQLVFVGFRSELNELIVDPYYFIRAEYNPSILSHEILLDQV